MAVDNYDFAFDGEDLEQGRPTIIDRATVRLP